MGKTRTRKTVSATPTRAYAKVALSAEETLHRLWQRGLRIDDRPSNLRMLRSIGHFRLLVYMRRFQNPATKRFWPRTRFSDVVELYAFDRRLRSVTMDAIERIEVALRAALSNPLAIDYGSHWYVERDRFADLRHYARILDQIARECETRKGSALTHYYRTYASPDLPPIWLVCERLSLGALSRIFSALSTHDRKVAGRHVWPDIPDTVLTSWLQSLTDLRNACAHHARLWGMKLTVSPPAKPAGRRLVRYAPEMTRPETFYARATMMKALLDPLGHGGEWREALRATLTGCEHVDPATHLGFTTDWHSTPAWQ
ncbi:Abi family protein [Burkholderia cepacia]|uniref:Abi family protein n=1 Tax=Burkholderia sp. AU27893 TaxID=2015351 RepID=UPI000B79CD21|nr:Abi family protein [Burkholderia sp. AU27893]EKS9798693.1 Abi family protein [Burkholderia cepacia]EKS9802391.1 Abi family protein [Burkholderia cepacia]EKS9809705.1 Abi family protein [Burkholderia cepacia]EKS9823741.1 Abi family protein [Burkholderia cepacia]EKS9824275.1 Abi family protein [Burkholderia cepacia]